MKKIFSILLTALAVSALAPAASGQDQDWSIKGQIKDPKYPGQEGHIIDFPKDPGHTIDKKKNFGYSKTVATPFSDGTYWLKLESFATGSADIVDKPSDIILVLDVSGSMGGDYGTDTSTALYPYGFGTSTFGYNGISHDQIKSGTYSGSKIRYNGNFYTVKGLREGPSTAYEYYLYFETVEGDESTRHWLKGYDILDTKPEAVTGRNTPIFYDRLWRIKRKSKMDALKEAVNEFIRIINENDMYVTDPETGEIMIDPETGEKVKRTNDEGDVVTLGNRISIVKFAHATYYNTDHLVEGNHRGPSPANTSLNYAANYTELVKNVTFLANGGKEALEDAIDGLVEGSSTAADYGLTIANDVLNQASVKNRNSNKVVVFFTDGEPNHSDGFVESVANAAVKAASTAKTTYGATIFSVGVFGSNINSKTHLYMERVSSDYKNATAYNNGTQVDTKYYKRADNNLVEVFADIAKQAGGSGGSLSAASSNVDIVSHSFKFPDDVTAQNIGTKVKIFTAKLNHIENLGEENEKYVFDTEILAGHSNDKYKVYDDQGNVTGEYFVDEHSGTGVHGQGLKAEMVTTPDGNKGVKVTNFDYSNNWCGPIKNQAHQVTGYQGHKIVILIPIQMNPEAVGGPNVQTNGEGSGIFINGNESYLEFKSPTVSLPVNIHIEKTGIEGVESAKFTIERAVLPDLPAGQDEYTLQDIQNIPEANWKYVTTVFVTNSDNAQHDVEGGNPVVRVKGLPATEEVDGEQKGLVYRVSEETWSWAYNPLGAKYQYTVTGQVNNPFTFKNENKNTAVKHAESKVTNIFKSGTTKVFDDSKDNGR